MQITDTHAHLYMDDFKEDLESVVERAERSGITRIYLPNVDESSLDPMFKLCSAFPKIFRPMIGLHPCYVTKAYEQQISTIFSRMNEMECYAVGEIGIDLYWDTSLKKQQIEAFELQTTLALEHGLPIVIHSRESLDLIIELLQLWKLEDLKGIFHCFTGTIDQAKNIVALGFKLGIGGVITYKNSSLGQVISEIGIQDLVLETDAPYLSPVPYRGKRNESFYLLEVLKQISRITGLSEEEIAQMSQINCDFIFGKCE
jgi:TatD DNase family protein